MSIAKPYRDIIINSKSELIKLKSFMDSLPRVNKKLKRLLSSNNAYIGYYTDCLYRLASLDIKTLYLYNRAKFTKDISVSCDIRDSVLYVTLKYTGIKYDMVSHALSADRSNFVEGQHTGGTGYKFIQDDYNDGYLVSHSYKYDELTRISTTIVGYQLKESVIECSSVQEKTFTFTLRDAVDEGATVLADMCIYLTENGTDLLDTPFNEGRFYMFGKNYAVAELIYNIVCYSEQLPSLKLHLEDATSFVRIQCKMENLNTELCTILSRSIAGPFTSLHIDEVSLLVTIEYKYDSLLRRYI